MSEEERPEKREGDPMREKNRTFLVIAIAATILAAVFFSIVLPALTGRAPEVLLPDVNQQGTQSSETFLPVTVTPETVQNVIASLSRPDSYRRTLTVRLYWEGGESADQVEIWADGDYVRTAVTTVGQTQYRLVGDGKLRLWYTGDQTWQETEARDDSADLAQRIPTYEDVLDLPADRITAAGYEEKNGTYCIYAAVATEEGGQTRYWIDTKSGLLCGAETYEDKRKVYEMVQGQFAAPLEAGTVFSLPDGTVLHESSGVAVSQ